MIIMLFERNAEMEIKLTLDRIEEGRAILLDSDGKIFECQNLYDLAEGDILLCSIDDGEIKVIEKIDEETEAKKEEMSNRLKSLFSRGEK